SIEESCGGAILELCLKRELNVYQNRKPGVIWLSSQAIFSIASQRLVVSSLLIFKAIHFMKEISRITCRPVQV
ncbi:MAG TPA: hypothetical protein VK991_02900, partial [Halomonas sp.]|nr:hypothetical protein [Halomonas sp.]